MKLSALISLFIKAALAIALTIFSTAVLFGQETAEKAGKAEAKVKYKEFCSNNNSWNGSDRDSYNEMREMTLPATGNLSVDGGRNGGISVKGENRADVLVRACVQTWGTTDAEAKSLASSVKIGTSPQIKAEGASEEGWSVSYEILAPRNTDLKLTAHNGGISIGSVDGRLEFETTNGGVSLNDVGGDVKGRTTNGGVNVSLTGNAWRGSGLDVQTSNGGVHLSIPDNYAANIETGTVNGGFKSDIASLNVEKDERNRPRATKLNTALNGGGAPIRVVTTNGGIHISSAERSANQ